jgi:23S rRNA (cytidine2498-2'-O)-methyltransferase
MSGTGRALITCAPESEAVALEELREIAPGAPPPAWIDDGLALMETGVAFDAFAAEVERRSPVFLRHIAPAEREVVLRGDAADVEALRAAALELAPRLDPARTFAVQARVLAEGARPYRKFTINSALSEALAVKTGAVMECRMPDQAVSVLCMPRMGYLGVSRVEQNRSLWPGGEHRFRREEGQISRSEFKLLEAFGVFDLRLPESGAALDLGAAPGGWSRTLRNRGLRVVAVDPADMDARLRRDPMVIHVRKRVEEYLPAPTRFAVLVNDMRLEALASVEVMRRAAPCLLPGGLAVMTLKLPETPDPGRDDLATVRLALDRLTRTYKVLGARQLYHNRSEVTVALAPRTS